jgi:nucleolar protein 53
VVKEKSNELIFSVDLGGDEKIIKKEGPTLPKPLKADEVLAARSAIPAVAARKRKSCNVTDGLVEFKKKHKNGISFAQLQRLRGIAYGGQSTTTVLTKPGKSLPDYDPWAEPNPLAINAAEADDNKFDFIEKKKPIKAPATLKHKPIALSATGTVPAVRLPAAGISYNPQYEKWEELLHEEGEKEVVREKKRLEQEAEERRIAELTAQPDPESASGSEESEDDQQTEARNTVIREAKRKTQAQKNKARRLKEIEMKRGEERKLKKQERELLLVKKYARDLKKRENLRIANAIAKKTIVDDKKNPKIMRKKKFGKVEYVAWSPPPNSRVCVLTPLQNAARAAGNTVDR